MYLAHPFARLFLLSLLVLTACDSADVDDEEITATTARIILTGEAAADSARFSAGNPQGLLDGVILEQDTLVLTAGRTYSGELNLLGAAGGDVTAAIRADAEQYQIFYEPSGLERLRIRVTDTETNYGTNDFGINMPVGLKISVETPDVAASISGSVRVKVGHFRRGMKNGYTLTVDPKYDFVVPVVVKPYVPPPPPANITGLRLELDRNDDLRFITVDASRPGGLNLEGARIAPELVQISDCRRESTDEAFTCTDVNEVELFQQERYDGSLTITDTNTGEAFTEHIRSNRDRFRFYYDLNFSPSGLTFDTDSNGLPVGLEIEWVLPTGIQVGGGHLGFRLFEFATAEDKAANNQLKKLLDFRVRFELWE